MKKIKNLFLFIPITIVAILIVTVIITGTRQSKVNNEKNNTIKIVTSLNFYASMAKAVGGNKVSTMSAINNQNIDPHSYTPTAAIAKEYQKAQLIISNGGGVDSWSTRFAQANKKASSIVIGNLVNYKTGDNPHFWYKPEVPKLLVNKLVQVLSEDEPQNKQEFKNNATKYLNSLKPLTKLRKEIKPLIKNKKILTTEPVMDDTLIPLGAKIVVPEFALATENDTSPSSTTIKDWHNAVDSGKISMVILNKQTSNKTVDQAVAYAKSKKIPVVGVTATKPGDKTFEQWQAKQLEEVKEALS